MLISWTVVHLQWMNGERKMSKICLIAFAPDGAADNGKKFIVAANKGMLVQNMKPNRDFQINNWDDLNEEKLQSYFN